MQVKWYGLEEEERSRRLGMGLRRVLRAMDPDGTVILDMRDFQSADPEEDVFELMVSLNCCSPHGPLPGRRIVLVVNPGEVLRAIEWNLDKIRRANLAVVDGSFTILGSAFSGTPKLLYATTEAEHSLTITKACQLTRHSRRVVSSALDELLRWGLVMQLPSMEARAAGAGRPATSFGTTIDLLGARVTREIQSRDVPSNSQSQLRLPA